MNSNCLFILMICLSTYANAQIVQEGNIARYYFNNGNANDDIGQNDGVIYGAVLSNDRFDNMEHAFNFNNAFIRIDHDDELELGTGEFSISAWFKTENNNAYGVIFNKGEGTTIKPRIFIRTMESPLSTFQWRVGDGINNVTVSHTDASYFDNKWHHIVLVRKSNSLSLYLDAILIDLTTDNQLPIVNVNSDRPILLGVQDSVYASSGNVPFGNYFDGSLDDYRIYNRAINALEVDSLYNEGDPSIISRIQDHHLIESITLFPNPANDYIKLNDTNLLGIDEFEIVNAQGKQIRRSSLKEEQINISNLENGLHFLKLYKEKALIAIQRFIKT